MASEIAATEPLQFRSTTTVTTQNGEKPAKERRSIALCAHSMRTRDLAPVADDQWIIFGLNNLHRFIPRGHLWIQVHTPEYLAKHPAYSKEDLAFYETLQIPLFAQRHFEQWPTSFPLPLDELRTMFPRVSWDSTMCYMVGLAIWMIERGEFPSLGQPNDLAAGAVPERRFGMWGLDMLDNYAHQGPQIGYLIGVAERMGIEVVVPAGAGFFRRSWLYGYEQKEIGKRRSQIETRKAELEGGLKQVIAKRAETAAQLGALDQRIIGMQAAIGENDYQMRNFTPEDDLRPPAETLGEAATKVALALGGNAPE